MQNFISYISTMFETGELKDPSNAIPKGTMSAVCFTFVTYLVMTWLIGATCTR